MGERIRGFGSDNHAGVHPEVLRALEAANRGHAHSYGDDPWTEAAVAAFRAHFGPGAQVFFVFNGTAANVASVAALTRSYQAVICARSSHLNTDECGAPEKFAGCKLLAVEAPDGKLDVERIAACLGGRRDEHQVQPKVVSITQASELGTVYGRDEVRAIAAFCHERGLYLHMDGARLANAAAGLDLSLGALSGEAGVDVLSFGGTKNGLLGGEAVVFFDPELAGDFRFVRKQAMQLASKMRFVSAQFTALLEGDLWRRSAAHANAMARLLADRVRGIPGVEITQKVQANAVFARLPKEAIAALRAEYFFYPWDEERGEVRWMASFDTTEEDVRGFAALVEQTLSERRGW